MPLNFVRSTLPSALSPQPAALCLVLCCLAACDVSVRDGKISADIRTGTAEATREWDRRYPMAPGGRVEVVNSSGPVDITTGQAGEVEVHAVIVATTLTDAGAQELLATVEIQETATPESVKVATTLQRRTRVGDYEVRYRVRVPPDAYVDVSLTGGTLTAAGLSGSLKADIVNGSADLSAMTGGLDAATVNGRLSAKLDQITSRVRLEATNGRISMEIPAAARANLSARSVNGGLTVTGLDVEEPTGRGVRDLVAALNGGGPEVELRVTNGRIEITGR